MSPSGDEAEDEVPRRRAWGSLSRAQIVAAGLEIARNEGMRALTIRRLASDLGASRMALYRHVPDKDALVGLIMDAIAEHDVEPPDLGEGPWQDRLRRLAEAMRRELAVYPGLLDIHMTRAHVGPGALHLVESALDVLADAGLDEEQAARHYLVFADLVLGRLHRELRGDPVDPHRTADLLALAERTGDHPRLAAAAPHLRDVAPGRIFDDELSVLVLAIEATVRSS
ncbi:TetR/AcrR family transcriptional regulator C-terminal domain-containing protein [Streptomyces sp. NPDC032161]|uniref:TetR/AcrR family transcriptional regulator C-terminal domain-containing protein n=1 Tax=unclassified Streptomyces TaxID=2593676 RepID=UPI0034029FCF